jgi:hypothetical protein
MVPIMGKAAASAAATRAGTALGIGQTRFVLPHDPPGYVVYPTPVAAQKP